MNPCSDDWNPSPEILVAYFDGELSGRPELDQLRCRVAQYLRQHPEAHAILDDYRRLTELWQHTRPIDPGPRCWEEMESHLDKVAPALPPRLLHRGWLGAIAAAAAIAVAVWLGIQHNQRPRDVTPAPPVVTQVVPEEIEVLQVATAAEVTILRVEGDDTPTLIVGELPLRGLMELLGPGEIALTTVRPDARDQMMPHIRVDGPHRPMIWAPVGAEAMER
jgi:hypothetical protein